MDYKIFITTGFDLGFVPITTSDYSFLSITTRESEDSNVFITTDNRTLVPITTSVYTFLPVTTRDTEPSIIFLTTDYTFVPITTRDVENENYFIVTENIIRLFITTESNNTDLNDDPRYFYQYIKE